MQVTIKLSEEEYNYLLTSSFVPSELKILLSSLEESNKLYLLSITDDQADEFRNLCSEQLQMVGFDEQYELMPKGKILESLIDKFFVE